MSDYDAALLTSLIAVWLALAWKCVFRIVKNLVVILLRRADSNNNAQENQIRRPLLPVGDRDMGAAAPRNVTEILERSKGGGDLLTNIEKYVRQSHSRHRLGSVIIGQLFFGLFVLWIIAGVYSAVIETDSVALWASDYCGVWMFDVDNAGEGAATRADVRDRSKESRAGEYAKGCYQHSDYSLLQTKDCGFFYQPAIPFTNKTTYECPFPDDKICAPETPAITFDTGLVDASQIGVNGPITYKFRRSTTCTPLNTDYPFVQSEARNGTQRFYYHYGEIVDGDRNTNYTFSSAGNPFDVLAPVYKVSAYATSWYPEYDYWRPRPELSPPENSTLTILFISALHILYLDSSSDPIFIADEKYLFEGEPKPWWYKSDSRFGVLACIDNHQLCSPDGQTCWSMTDVRNDLSPDYWLMKLSLEASNIYDAVARRLGSALIAQERVSQSASAGLRDDHWRFEAARLFATSLARIQFDAWSIASGEDREQEGFIDLTPDEAKDLCGLFKFKSTGFRNLGMRLLICLVLVPPLLWILSLEVRNVRDKLSWAWTVLKGPWKGPIGRIRQDQPGNAVGGNGPNSDRVVGGGNELRNDVLDEGVRVWSESQGSIGGGDQERANWESEDESTLEEQHNDTQEEALLDGASDDIIVLFFLVYLLWVILTTILRRIGVSMGCVWHSLGSGGVSG
ncbi:hypothetical protein EDB81DRAFT_368049 [Dactylonectria macrodidyma]|uniref:Uncharacterized protein n=1 Tax=Dactylonectria macrodidyma TaxID=307937 RepID=A0A9P9I7Z3_9HYPO|nr:hypothetical protein EDB81DRAFT_368049 [Dactylonectria macrodidyma]